MTERDEYIFKKANGKAFKEALEQLVAGLKEGRGRPTLSIHERRLIESVSGTYERTFERELRALKRREARGELIPPTAREFKRRQSVEVDPVDPSTL